MAAAPGEAVKVQAGGGILQALPPEKEDIRPNIGYVSGGRIEILDRQRVGWMCLKGD